MKRLFKMLAAGMLANFSLAGVSRAEPFDPRHVPADAKWLLHLDMDAARDTKIWGLLNDRLMREPSYQSKLTEVEQITGLRFPQDVKDVTLFGKSAGEDAGVVLIHGKFDRDKTVTAIQGNDKYASQQFGTYQVLSWEDKGVTNFGAFHDDSLVVIGRSEENVEGALNAMDGKTESIKGESVLAKGAGPKTLLYIAAKDLQQLKKPDVAQSPLVGQIDNAWINVSEMSGGAMVRSNLTAKTPEVAQQIYASVEGIQAVVNLAANSENADPNTKNAAAALATLKPTLDSQKIRVEWPVSLDILKSLLDKK